MNDEQALSMLLDQAHDLDKEIRGNDHEMQRLLHALGSGDSPSRAIEALQDYQNRQSGLNFDLGKLQAQIEDLEHRIQEAANRSHEGALSDRFADGQDVSQEDYLDWLRPSLEEPEEAIKSERDERHPHYDGEDRMLQDMHREGQEPEDYLDWWKR